MRLFLFIAIAVVSALIASTPSHAQDVYNFYFQKNQGLVPGGPVTPGSTTNMLGPAETAQAARSVPESSMQTTVAQGPVEKAAFNKWEISGGRAWIGATADVKSIYTSYDEKRVTEKLKSVPTREGVSMTGSYRFNKFVSADLGIFAGLGWSGGNEGYRYLGTGKSFDGSLGFTVTPIHINLFGYELIEFSIMGGAMTQTNYKVTEVDQEIENETGWSYSSSRKKEGSTKQIVPYLGPKLTVNLTPELGVSLEGRLNPKSQGGGVASLGLRYRF